MSREELTSLLTRLRQAEPSGIQQRLEELAAGIETLSARFDQREELLLRSMEVLDDRLARVENSVLFRFNRFVGRTLDTYKKKLGQWLLKSPWHAHFLRIAPPAGELYLQWVQREQASLPSREWHRSQSAQWTFHPCISIVMPVHQPKRDWLEAAIASVQAQSYESWQLCLCDDASGEPWLEEYLRDLAQSDPRIRFKISETRLGIAAASNCAGTLVDGDYVAFLDHDDVLPWYALHYIAEACQEPGVQIIYSDEDCLDSRSKRERPRFKPDWSPELLTGCMYLGHLLAVERHLLEEVAWFREGFDGAQDHDLAMRLSDGSKRVRHVPRVLYHWRRHEGSTAANPQAKAYAQTAGRRAVEDTLRRRGIEGSVEEDAAPGVFHIRRAAIDSPLVSVITCSRDPQLAGRMLSRLDKVTEYRNFEVVLVEHRSGDEEFRLPDLRVRLARVPFSGVFNFAAMNNLGAKSASGSMLLFLNDDVEPLRADWLGRLVSQLQRIEVGAAGAKLLYPSGAIQHAGIALGMMDGVGHPGRGLFRSDLFPWLELSRNVSAVTGACLAVRRDLFEESGGFDAGFPVNYNDVDLCLRLRERGYEIIYDASAQLVHKESASRAGGTRLRERVKFYSRWFALLEKGDPYVPAALDRTDEGMRLKLD